MASYQFASRPKEAVMTRLQWSLAVVALALAPAVGVVPEPQASLQLGEHENLRGPGYYQH